MKQTAIERYNKTVPLSVRELNPHGLKTLSLDNDGFISVSTPRNIRNFEKEAGDLWLTSVVSPVINWAQRAITEARICLAIPTEGAGQSDELVHDDPFVQLVRRPSQNWQLSNMLSATITSYLCDGNAYWRKRRNRPGFGGSVVELEYLPHFNVEPKWPQDGSEWLTHYDYTTSTGRTERIEREDMIHFRYGMSLDNPRLGLSPLKSQLGEIVSDKLVSVWLSGLLKNSGVPSIIVQDKSEFGIATESDANTLRDRIERITTGNNVGRVLVTSGDIEIQKLAFSPGEFGVADLRKIFESRVCAALGISTVVLGYLSGVEHATDNKQAEYHKSAWTAFVLPTLRAFAETLEMSLLPEFGTRKQGVYVTWDTSRVMALRENQDALAKRAVQLYAGGILTRTEARRITGQDEDMADPERNSYRAAASPVTTVTGTEVDVQEAKSDRVLKAFLSAYSTRGGGM